ncbi:MAG: transcriptional repressor [Eubacteriales bacterium]
MMKRNTIQRSLVLDAVNKLRCHATADEIYEEIVKEHPNISRATVYRNLNLLSEEGKIRKMEIPGGADRFDHMCHEHCHVRCEKCGRVFDVDMEYITGLEKNIKNDRGFDFTGYDILFRGICPDCKKRPHGKGEDFT